MSKTIKIKDYPNTEAVLAALGVKENHLYEIRVKCSANNMEHRSFLFVGFLVGSYCTVYNNSYEQPLDLSEVYSVQLIKELCEIRSYK